MAGELPAEIGAALLDNARTAFAFGFSIAAVSAAVIMLALAIVVPRMLARQRSTTSPDEVPMTPAPDGSGSSALRRGQYDAAAP
ncbi:hypothetical protein GCM10029963_01650 [Micromonospora andamanensis]